MVKNSMFPSIEKFLPGPHQVIPDIESLTETDYRNATVKFVERISGLKGVRCIAQFGSVTSPGISDLDLLVIVSDQEWRNVTEHAEWVTRSIPSGQTIFWHPAAIIPESFVPKARVLHSFHNLHLLWGDKAILSELVEPGHPLVAVNAIVWNSFFWRNVLALEFGRHGLRKLLLILSNIVQSIASNERLLNQAGQNNRREQAYTVAWGRQVRAAILTASEEERKTLALKYLAESLGEFSRSDWRVQEWWLQNVSRQKGVVELQIELDERTCIAFMKYEEACLPRRSIGRVIRDTLNGTRIIPFPFFYLQVVSSISAAFEPRMDWQVSGGQDIDMNHSWREAISSYQEAVTSARAVCRAMGEPEFALFQEPFVVPFAA